jgi:hypothetical protein
MADFLGAKCSPRSLLGFVPPPRANRDNVERIDDIQQSSGGFDHNIVAAYQNKLRMRHRILLAVRCPNEKWPSASQLLANQHAVHVALIAPGETSVKQERGHVQLLNLP